jgi:PAS domain S-box-containing protein
MVFIMSVALTREWRRSHGQMLTVLNNVPAVVYLKKLDGRYVFVNRQFEQQYRLSAGAVLGKTDAQIFDIDRAAAHEQADREALAHGLIESEEAIDRDGVRRTYSIRLFALRDSDGSAHALCGIATDITDREAATHALRDLAVNLEHRVARRTGELAQVNRELEAFAYSVSHDLRAPLTSINGFAELLLREQGPKLDATANRYLTRIRDGSVRMAGLIQDLLGLSRVTQQSIESRPIDLLPPIEMTVKALREAEPTRNVTFTAPATIDAHGDLKLLSLALANLLANAWKYTGKTAEARVEAGFCEQAGEMVYFVKDNGAGFNPDYADRLFRPFVRLHSESEFPGTGIGLATVARIISRHGGRIWAESKLGQGATFFFTLPKPEEETTSAHKTVA